MKYLTITVLVILGIVAVWAVFFSGTILNKKTFNGNNLASENSVAPKSGGQKPLVVVLETNFGPIKVALDAGSAPQTAANFEKLAKESFYNGLTFHRIIPGFVIQGGDPKGDGTGGPGYTVPAEIKLLHKRGSVAMARLPDQVNPGKESSGSQFYIALQNLPQLDGQYTVFGQVISGMEIVDRIAGVKTDAADKPLEPVTIKKAYLEQ